MKTIADLIRDHHFLKDLEPRFVDTIAGCGRNEIIETGRFVFEEGGSADYFYLIRTGRIALTTHAPGQPETIFQTLEPGSILGLSWLIPPYRWNFSARVLETAHTIMFDAACLRRKCEEDHDLGYALMMRFVPALVARLTDARLQSLDLYRA